LTLLANLPIILTIHRIYLGYSTFAWGRITWLIPSRQ
jgi:hypothetical protein